MDNPAHPDPSQELPPPPEEKLLRAPTFWEKYGKYRWQGLLLFLVFVLGGVSIVANNTQTPQTQITPTLPQPSPTFFSSPTEDPTANWKTYISKDNSYQISYPGSWTVNDANAVSIGENRIEISIIDRSGASDSLWNSEECDPALPNDTSSGCVPLPIKKLKKLQIAENTVYWKVDGRDQIHAFIPQISRNRTIEIYTIYLRDQELFYQILSTFKFTE